MPGRPPPPPRIAALPYNAAGWPVPRFVRTVNGKPDFRIMDEGHFLRATKHRACWICGQPLGKFMAFVIGPMCVVNRISSEPPSHQDCASYAVRVCPFLSNPNAVRREKDMPTHSAGMMLAHNPEVSVVWMTTAWKLFQVDNGVLFDIGEPVHVAWWRAGRLATRQECVDAMARGLPALEALCEDAEQNAMLIEQIDLAMKLLPKPE